MADELDQVEAQDSGEELDDRRAVLEAAFDAATTEEAVEPEAPEAEAPTGRERDERGRFATKGQETPAQPEVEQPAQPETAHQPEQPTDTDLRAPQAWRPQAREAWAALPAEVRAEVHRRETEVQRAMSESAEVRRVGERLMEVARPYEAYIRADGSDPVQAAANMFRTAEVLRVGSAAQRAQTVAQIINQFGVDVGMLDDILSGQPQRAPQGGQQQSAAQFRDPRFDQFLGALQSQRQQQQRAAEQHAATELEQFAASREFFADVRDTMADLIEVNARKGVTLSYEQAYDMACRLDDGISKILQQRERAKAAQAQTERARRSRAAASSITGAPAGTPPRPQGGGSRREDIEAAFDEVVGG